MKKLIFTITLLFLSIFVFAEAFYIKHFDVRIEVNEKGYFDVVETLDVFFTEERRGINRSIPRRVKINGKTHSIKFENIEVEGWKKKVSRKNGNLNIRIGDKDIYLTGDQKYVIRYRVHRAFNYLDSHTEFYWNITGNEWEVPINKVTYEIKFPSNISLDNEDIAVFTGSKGQSENNTFTTQEYRTVTGESSRGLEPKEGITVAVKLPAGTIQQPPPPPTFQERNPLLAIPIALLGMIITWWRSRGRRRRTELDDEFEYYPPSDLNPSEVAVFYSNKYDTNYLVALIPMWARLGNLKIYGEKRDGDGMQFEKIQDLPDNAPSYEHTVFNALFKDSNRIFLSDLKKKLYSSVYKAIRQLYKLVKRKEYLFDSSSKKLFHSGGMLILGVLLLVAGINVLIFTKGIVTGVAFILISIAPFIIHFLRPRLSQEGEDAYLQIHRFKNFLASSSTTNVNELLEKDPDYFDRMYPYAVALGLDSPFTQKFEGSTMGVPEWYILDQYYYHNTMHHSPFHHFSEQFKPTEIKEVFNSAPAASSTGSGGAGGGGFSGGSSGGGFGGGGGSSW